MNIHITTNGYCSGRDHDIAKLLKYFILNGCRIVSKPSEADFIVIVTCAYREKRIKTAFELIERVRKNNKKIIITGCLPAIAEKEFNKRCKESFLKIRNLCSIESFFPDFEFKFSDIADESFFPEFEFENNEKGLVQRKVIGINNKSKTANLQICSGCTGNCSYCSIRHSIGKLKSKPLDLCLNEFKELLLKSYKIITLAGDDTGAYGVDIGSSFEELLSGLENLIVNKEIKLRLINLNPVWAIRYKDIILKLLKEDKIDFMLCPIQSGSSRIAGLMFRYPDKEKLIRIFREFKKSGKFFFQTQIIAGFPTETDDDFKESIDICINIGFDKVQLYPYFEGALSDSKALSNKIKHEIVETRIKKAIHVLKLNNIEACYEEAL